MPRPRLLTVQQAAQRLGSSDDAVRDLIRAGKFPGAFSATASEKRKHYRIPSVEVAAFIAARVRDCRPVSAEAR